MRVRSVFVVALALSLTASGLASAAPRPKPKPEPPICNVLTDPRGDNPRLLLEVHPSEGSGPTYDPNLDILSADVVNNATMVTAVIRLARLDANDSMAPTGRYYDIGLLHSSSGEADHLLAHFTATGTVYEPEGATGVLDTAKGEVRMSAPISAFPGRGYAKGDSVRVSVGTDIARPAVAGNPKQPNGDASLYELGDSGEAKTLYPLYARSCVTPGA
jgi:hypothetical protein